MASFKSNKYFGYIKRNPGTCSQNWVFGEIPVQSVSVVNSTSTASVPVNGVIPTTNVLYNQACCNMISSGYLSLTPGIYRFDVNLVATDAPDEVVKVDLKRNGATVATGIDKVEQLPGGSYQTSISFSTIQRVFDESESWTLTNSSNSEFSPVLYGTSSLQIIITKLA